MGFLGTIPFVGHRPENPDQALLPINRPAGVFKLIMQVPGKIIGHGDRILPLRQTHGGEAGIGHERPLIQGKLHHKRFTLLRFLKGNIIGDRKILKNAATGDIQRRIHMDKIRRVQGLDGQMHRQRQVVWLFKFLGQLTPSELVNVAVGGFHVVSLNRKRLLAFTTWRVFVRLFEIQGCDDKARRIRASWATDSSKTEPSWNARRLKHIGARWRRQRERKSSSSLSL